jgi:hypothetical protein
MHTWYMSKQLLFSIKIVTKPIFRIIVVLKLYYFPNTSTTYIILPNFDIFQKKSTGWATSIAVMKVDKCSV